MRLWLGRAPTGPALAAVVAATLCTQSVPVQAQDTAPDAWTIEKCVRYERAFRDLLVFAGPDGATEAFLKGNEAFIAAGCSNGADVCPRSEKDFELANALTIAAMNFGTASTFLPFVCR